jgi:hypothetical protein
VDEKTLELIEKHIEKLGGASEHIFKVMVDQALISGITDVLTCIALVFICIKSFNFVEKKTKSNDGYSGEWSDEGAFFAWAGLYIFLFVVTLTIICSVGTITAAFINPEYWAIMKLLSK